LETEVVTAGDGSLAVLLGASPGASTAVSIMLDLIQRCFSEHEKTTEWQEKTKGNGSFLWYFLK
jgi:malate dehydrogenase (quinone)